MPAALAVWLLGVAPSMSFALTVDPLSGTSADSTAAAPTPVLALTDAVTRQPDGLGPMPAGGERRRRLSISLFSGGVGSGLAMRPLAGNVGLATGDTPRPDDPLSAVLGTGTGNGRQASVYRLSYASGPMELTGRLVDVGSRFSLSPNEGGRPSAEDADAIKQAIGSRGFNLNAAWRLAPGLSLTSSHDRLRHDGILSADNGLSASTTSHALTLNLGRSTSVKAGLTQHHEEWDRWLARPGKERREERVEMSTGLGPGGAGGLRLAMGRVQSAEGESRIEESTREAHLSVAGTARLRLTGDYVSKNSAAGATQTTQAVGATLRLARGAELTAAMKALNASAGGRKREMVLGLTAKIAGGQLGAEQTTARGQGGLVSCRKLAFAGALGGGARTKVKLDFQESRGDRPEAELARSGLVRVDHLIASWLTLVAERFERTKGTTAAPEASAETKCEAVARLGKKTDVSAGLVTGERGGNRRGERRLAFSHRWPGLRLRVESGASEDGADCRSRFSYALEIPTGLLPDWAATISSAHQFTDAQQYLLGRKREWLTGDMPFTGYRLWGTQRAGGEDVAGQEISSRPTLGFAHRRIVAHRYHLQFGFEERPEATEGEQKGRPLPLRRQAVEVGGRVTGGINLRCGLGLQTGINSPENRLGRVRVGVWGRLGEGDQVEGEVWKESGQWDEVAVERTSVTVLYSRHVSEEHRLEFKLAYTWGEGAGSDRDRDCRFALAFDQPI